MSANRFSASTQAHPPAISQMQQTRSQSYPLVFGDVDPKQPLYSRTQLLAIFRNMCVEFDEAAHIQAIFHNPNSSTPAPPQPPIQLSVQRPSAEDLLHQQQQQPNSTASSTLVNYHSLLLDRPLPPLSISLEWKRQQHLEKQQQIREGKALNASTALSASPQSGATSSTLLSPYLNSTPSGMTSNGGHLLDSGSLNQSGSYNDPMLLNNPLFNDPMAAYGFGGFPPYNQMSPNLLQPQLSMDSSQTTPTNAGNSEFLLSNPGQPRTQYLDNYGFPSQQHPNPHLSQHPHPHHHHQQQQVSNLIYQFDLVRMFPHRDQPIWYYLDQLHQQQGPFPTESMSQWFVLGYLSDQLPLRYAGQSPIDGKHYEIHYFPLLQWFMHGKSAFLEQLPPRYAHLAAPQQPFHPQHMHPHIMHHPFNPMGGHYPGGVGGVPTGSYGAQNAMPLDLTAPLSSTASPSATPNLDASTLSSSPDNFATTQIPIDIHQHQHHQHLHHFGLSSDVTSPSQFSMLSHGNMNGIDTIPINTTVATINQINGNNNINKNKLAEASASPTFLDTFASLGYIPDEDNDIDDDEVLLEGSQHHHDQHHHQQQTDLSSNTQAPVKRAWGAIVQPVKPFNDTSQDQAQVQAQEDKNKKLEHDSFALAAAANAAATSTLSTSTPPPAVDLSLGLGIGTYVQRLQPIDYNAQNEEGYEEDEDQYPNFTNQAISSTLANEQSAVDDLLPSTRVERLAPVERVAKEGQTVVGQTPVKRGWNVIQQQAAAPLFEQSVDKSIPTTASTTSHSAITSTSSGWAKAAARSPAVPTSSSSVSSVISVNSSSSAPQDVAPITVVSRPIPTTTMFSSATIGGKSAAEALKTAPNAPSSSAWGKSSTTAALPPSTPVKTVVASVPAAVPQTPAKSTSTQIDSKTPAKPITAIPQSVTKPTPSEPEQTAQVLTKPMSADFHKWFSKELQKLFGSSDISAFEWLWEIEDKNVVRETLIDFSGSRQFADDFIHYRELDLKNGASTSNNFPTHSAGGSKRDDPKQWKTVSGGSANSDMKNQQNQQKNQQQQQQKGGVLSNNTFAALGSKQAQTFQAGGKKRK